MKLSLFMFLSASNGFNVHGFRNFGLQFSNMGLNRVTVTTHFFVILQSHHYSFGIRWWCFDSWGWYVWHFFFESNIAIIFSDERFRAPYFLGLDVTPTGTSISLNINIRRISFPRKAFWYIKDSGELESDPILYKTLSGHLIISLWLDWISSMQFKLSADFCSTHIIFTKCCSSHNSIPTWNFMIRDFLLYSLLHMLILMG